MSRVVLGNAEEDVIQGLVEQAVMQWPSSHHGVERDQHQIFFGSAYGRSRPFLFGLRVVGDWNRNSNAQVG